MSRQSLIEKVFAADGDKWKINLFDDTSLTIGEVVGTLLPLVSLTAGLLAFSYLIVSGFTYLTAGGNADASKKGSQGILNAIIGLVIISISYAIFQAITNYLNG